jgi:acyl carrier protein
MRDQIRKYITDHILVGQALEIDDQTALYSGGVISSMGHLKLLQFLERTFRVAIPMNQVSLEEFDTVERIASFVEQRMK